MDYLARKLHDFRSIFTREEKIPDRKREITRIDAYFEFFYKILSWQDTAVTLTSFLVLNFVFWLVVQFQLRFFGVVFLLCLATFIGDSYLGPNQLVPEQIDALDEFRNDVIDVVLSLKALRKDSPSSFCIGMSFIFLFISFVARSMSGYVIFYLTLLAVFFIPLGLSKLPPEYVASIKHFVKALGSDRGVLAEDELIPFIFNKDIDQRDADLDSLLTDKTADSVTNSLISGLTSMPSYLDAEDHESLEEDDLIPQRGTPIADFSTDSDSDHKGIRFESRHFNGDSSSSEDDALARNLKFPNIDSVDKGVASAVGDNLLRIAGAIKTAVTGAATRKDSSSDSEFEIINSDEADGQ